MFLIDAIKHNVEKKFKTYFIFFTLLFGGGESQAYKIKKNKFCFFSCYLFWRQQKLYSKEIRKIFTT